MPEPILTIDDLHTYFRTDDGIVRAVDGVSFSLEQGETLGIVGESGSGKSVTCLSAMRLVPSPPAYFPKGKVIFKGRDLLTLSKREMRDLRGNEISMIFQDPMSSLNPFLKISRQLTEVLEVHKNISRRDARKAAIEMLERVGIPAPAKRIDDYPHQFSGGMRQRVMIAIALLCEPKLLIADEPTTALDVTIQAQILDLIEELKTKFGTSVIFITHDLGVVAGIADRLAVMYAGRIVEQGTTEEVFENPRHPYTRGLLASIPRLDERSEELQVVPGLPPDLSALPSGCAFHPRCSLAVDKCKEEYPDKISFGGERWAACWEARES